MKRISFSVVSAVAFGILGCAAAPEVADTPAEVTRANGVLRLSRMELETIFKARGEVKTKSGKTVTRKGTTYRIQWTENAVPVIAGKERVGQIDKYDGAADLERRDLESLMALMEEARVRAKGVRVPEDLTAPTLVRCDAHQCAIDLPVEAAQSPKPEVATLLRQALTAQPPTAATSRK